MHFDVAVNPVFENGCRIHSRRRRLSDIISVFICYERYFIGSAVCISIGLNKRIEGNCRAGKYFSSANGYVPDNSVMFAAACKVNHFNVACRARIIKRAVIEENACSHVSRRIRITALPSVKYMATTVHIGELNVGKFKPYTVIF